MSSGERRVWRLRGQGHQMDALLRAAGDGWALRLVLDGEPVLERHFATPADAFAFAATPARELHLAGWYGHW